jgi:REP element-mobilizing transposase RayT
MHFPLPDRTTWHITFGTYGTRLHGGVRPTVDHRHNTIGEGFLDHLPRYEQVERDRLAHSPRLLTSEHRNLIESNLAIICERGGWTVHACVAAVDHVHVLLEADRDAEGKTIRTLLKRWTTQLLSERFPERASSPWWAEGGSNKVVDCESYFESAREYIARHRKG